MAEFKDNLNYYVSRLREYSKYDSGSSEVKFCYEQGGELKSLISEFNLDEIAGNGDQISKIINLMFWIQKTLRHKGDIRSLPEKKMHVASLNMPKKKVQIVGCYLLLY